MKKRIVFAGLILSLIPIGQPLLIKTGVLLSSSAVLFSFPIKVNSESNDFYFNNAFKKSEKGDHYGAISDYTKAIEIDPQYALAYTNRSESKENIGDIKGACADAKKAFSLGDEDANESWIEKNCKFLKDI